MFEWPTYGLLTNNISISQYIFSSYCKYRYTSLCHVKYVSWYEKTVYNINLLRIRKI